MLRLRDSCCVRYLKLKSNRNFVLNTLQLSELRNEKLVFLVHIPAFLYVFLNIEFVMIRVIHRI